MVILVHEVNNCGKVRKEKIDLAESWNIADGILERICIQN